MCDAVVADATALVPFRDQNQPEPDDWVIFPPVALSKEPLGPAYRNDDTDWASVVDWTIYALMIAEERSVTSANVDEIDPNENAVLRRLLTEANFVNQSFAEVGIPSQLPLEPDAFYQAIKQVGNYGEIFERNLETIGIVRTGTLNASYEDGGLIYAPPFG